MPSNTDAADDVATATEQLSEGLPSLAPKMLAMMRSINDLQAQLQPLVKKPHFEVLAKLTPLERAKIQWMEVYSVNTLFWGLMAMDDKADDKLQADYKLEMMRIKDAQKRLSELEARASMQRIDRAAARRFVQHGLGVKRKANEVKCEDEGEEIEEEEEEVRPRKRKNTKLQAEIDATWK